MDAITLRCLSSCGLIIRSITNRNQKPIHLKGAFGALFASALKAKTIRGLLDAYT